MWQPSCVYDYEYMMVKNEAKVITRMLDSVLPLIDSYCICDTGMVYTHTIPLPRDLANTLTLRLSLLQHPPSITSFNHQHTGSTSSSSDRHSNTNPNPTPSSSDIRHSNMHSNNHLLSTLIDTCCIVIQAVLTVLLHWSKISCAITVYPAWYSTNHFVISGTQG